MMVMVFHSAQLLLLPLSGGGGDTKTPSGAGGGWSYIGEVPGRVSTAARDRPLLEMDACRGDARNRTEKYSGVDSMRGGGLL